VISRPDRRPGFEVHALYSEAWVSVVLEIAVKNFGELVFQHGESTATKSFVPRFL
jgi:hypothetical protein